MRRHKPAATRKATTPGTALTPAANDPGHRVRSALLLTAEAPMGAEMSLNRRLVGTRTRLWSWGPGFRARPGNMCSNLNYRHPLVCPRDPARDSQHRRLPFQPTVKRQSDDLDNRTCHASEQMACAFGWDGRIRTGRLVLPKQ